MKFVVRREPIDNQGMEREAMKTLFGVPDAGKLVGELRALLTEIRDLVREIRDHQRERAEMESVR